MNKVAAINTKVHTNPQQQHHSVANQVTGLQQKYEQAGFNDQRPQTVTQKKLQHQVNNSPVVQQGQIYQRMANQYTAQHPPIQKQDKPGAEPATPEIPFTGFNNDAHHLVLEKKGNSYEVMVHSNTFYISQYIIGLPGQKKDKEQIWTAYYKLKKLVEGQQAEKNEDHYAGWGQAVTDQMRALAELINAYRQIATVKSQALFTEGPYGGTDMQAYVTFHPGEELTGSRPHELKQQVQFLNSKKQIHDEQYYHRSHLLANMFNGPGEKKNLMIAPGNFNINIMRDDVESKVAAKALSGKENVFYHVEPTYDRAITYGWPQEKYIPTQVKFHAATLKNIQTDDDGYVTASEENAVFVDKTVTVDNVEIIPLSKSPSLVRKEIKTAKIRQDFNLLTQHISQLKQTGGDQFVPAAQQLSDVLETMLSHGEEHNHQYYIELYVLTHEHIDATTGQMAETYMNFTWE